MENKQPLLSICIPTYNRAKYLEGALENIVSDAAFDSRIEVVISDNASTDETFMVCERFVSRYTNIHYYRNAENVKDRNFMLALQRASGKYVRLFNDTLRLKEGTLIKMLDVILIASEDKPLFFFQNILFLSRNRKVEVGDTSALLATSSYYITWIANFGNWKKYINSISEPYKYLELMLTQVDWVLHIVKNANISVVYFGEYFESKQLPQKGGYNLFEVFVTNYLHIVKQYVFPCTFAYQREKYRLFRYFLLNWFLQLLLVENADYTFSSAGAYKKLLKEYWYCPYFYAGIAICWLRKSLSRYNSASSKQ